jgi:hypothetical protein
MADDEAAASLAEFLLQRLRLACGQATDADDRQAFLLGIAAAREICRSRRMAAASPHAVWTRE